MHSKLQLYAAAWAIFICGPILSANHANAQTQIQPGQILISELRVAGEGGSEDEFVELYNNTDQEITVQATDTTPGWAVQFPSARSQDRFLLFRTGREFQRADITWAPTSMDIA